MHHFFYGTRHGSCMWSVTTWIPCRINKKLLFFSFLTKELLNGLEYRFKNCNKADKKVEDVVESMKNYVKGQRSIIFDRYDVFTQRQQYEETFEDWHCELKDCKI